MLSFDLKVGSVQYYNGGIPSQGKVQEWGYLTTGAEGGVPPYGTLTHLQSTIGVGNILVFNLSEFPIGSFFSMELQVDAQNQPDLYSKNLEVTVDGSTYDLGSKATNTIGSGFPNVFDYDSDGAKQLGALLKQHVDSWVDWGNCGQMLGIGVGFEVGGE
ncbi:hypothetical protein Xenpb_03439 [Xenorhabdus sp. PB62.4]|nr:hypothetical protein [Xenorhabdus sp. PB62.4]